MANIKFSYLLFAWVLWLAAGAYFFHSKCGTSTGTTSEVVDKLTEEATVESQVLSTASFADSEYNFIQPLSSELSKRIDSYLDQMKSNKKENLIITALYGSHEDNTGIFPDLGLARANNMKQLFVQQGVDPYRIAVKSKKISSKEPSEYTGLEFNYTKDLQNDNTLEDYIVLFEHNPIIIYLNSNEDDLELSQDQRIAFTDLMNYMDLDKDVKINVGGHTDNIGDRESNIALSKKRAIAIRDKLIANGFDAARIRVIAYGSDRAIAGNKTSVGRAKNRRVEISVE